MASGGYTAGIAKITIRPDLSEFKSKLEAQIQKHLHDRVIDIRANLENEGKLEQSLESLTRDRDVSIKTDVDQAAKRKTEADLKPLSKDIAPHVAPEVDKGAVAKVEKAKAELAETITPEVAPEIDKAAAAQTKAQVEAVAEDQRAVITPDLDNAAAKAVDAKLDEIAKDRDPVITPKVDKKAAEKALKSLDQRAMAAQTAAERRRNPKSQFEAEPLSELKEAVEFYRKQVSDEVKRIESLGKGKKGFKGLYEEFRTAVDKMEIAKTSTSRNAQKDFILHKGVRDRLADQIQDAHGIDVFTEDRVRRQRAAGQVRNSEQAVRAREGAITQFRAADENAAKLEAQRAAKVAAEAAKEEAKRAADRERIARLAREKEASEKAAAERKEMLKARLARIVAAGQAKQDRERAEYAESRRSRATERLNRLRANAAPAVNARPSDADVDKLIRKTYDDLASSQGSYVRLSRLRDKLNELTREEIDASLIRLRRTQVASVIPEENQKTLSQQDRDDAVTIGNQQNHLLAFEGPAPKPQLAPEPKKAVTTPPPAVAEKPVKVEQEEETEAEAARRIEREEKLAERIASRKVGVTNAAKQVADADEAKAADKVADKVADSVDDLSESTEDLLKKTTAKVTAPTPAASKAKRGSKSDILASPIPENPADAIHLLNKKLGYLTKDLADAEKALPERKARAEERGKTLADAIAASDEAAVKKAKSAASSANTSVKNTEKKIGTLAESIEQNKTLLSISTEALEASQKADAERARQSRIEAGKRKVDETVVTVSDRTQIDTGSTPPPIEPPAARPTASDGDDERRPYDIEATRRLQAQRRRQRDKVRAERREQAAERRAAEQAASERWRAEARARTAARKKAREDAQQAAEAPNATPGTPGTDFIIVTPQDPADAPKRRSTVGSMRNSRRGPVSAPADDNYEVDAFEKWAKSVVRSNSKGLKGNRQAQDTRDKFIQFARDADTSARSVTRFERDAADAVDRVNIALRRQAELRLDASTSARDQADADTEVNAAQRDQIETARDLAKAQKENDRARRNAFGFEQAFRRDLKAQDRIQLQRTKSQTKAALAAAKADAKMGATNYQVATQAADDLGAKRRPATASRKVGDASTLGAIDLDVANEYIAAAKQMDVADANRRKAIDAVQQATIKLASIEEDLRLQRKNGNADSKAALALEGRKAAADAALLNTLERQRQANAELGGARARFIPAKAKFDDRNDAGPVKRLGQALGSIGAGVLDQVNEKILLMGRQLSAVSAIARFAAMGLAGLGAVNLVPVIASLSQMANIGALLPAVFTAAGAALGAVVIGSFGIGDAFKAATKMSDNAGKDAKDKARDQAQAAKSERNARRSLENAQRSQEKSAVSGARSIVNAEKSVAQAQKQSVNAQKNLSDARESAIDKIADLNDALRGNALDEEGAAQAIERAREAYGRTLQDPEANSLDRREADLNIRQAVENFEQIKKRNREAVVEAREATKAGVEGDEQVIAAKEGIVEANQGVADAEESLAQARADAAESNADAARSVADAQENLNEVLSTNAEKMSEASTAATEYDEAMAKLAPSARAFVEQMRAMGASWTDLRMLVQENLFKNLGDSITKLAEKQLPNLKEGLAGIASELNGGVRDSIGVLSTDGERDYTKKGKLAPNAQEDFRRFLANTTSATGTAANAMAPLTQAFIDLTTVGSDRLPRMARAIEDVSNKFSEMVGEARASGRLDEIMDSGIEKTKQFGRITGDVFVSIRRVFQAVRGDGDDMLTVFERGAQRMRDFFDSAEGQNKTRDFFQSVRESFDRLMTIVGDVASVLVTQVFPAFSNVASIVGPVIEAVANCARAILELGDGLKYALTAFLLFKTFGTLSGIARGVQGAIDTLRIRMMFLSDTMARQTGTTAFSRALGAVSTSATGLASRSGGLGALLSMLGGPWVVGIGAAVGVIYGMVTSLSNLSDKTKLNEQIMRDHAERMKTYSESLQDALNASNGVANESVRGLVGDEFSKSMDDLEKQAANRASGWQKLWESMAGAHNAGGEADGTTPIADRLEAEADRAQEAIDLINQVNTEYTEADWANIITSSNGDYEALAQKFRDMGPAGEIALSTLERQRTKFLETKDGASEFAAALEKVERKQLDVVSATDSLNSANARSRGEALLMEDAQAQATESISRFRSLINGEGFNWLGLINTQGEIDKTTDAGTQLYSQVKSLQTAFDDATNSAYVNAVNNGAGVEQAAQAALDAGMQFRDQLIAQTDGSDAAIASVDKLLGRYGMTPTDIATRFDVDIDPATGKVQTLVDGINNTEASIKVNIDQGKVDEAIAMFGVGSPEAIAAAGLGPTAQGQANWDYRKENGLELSTAPVEGAPQVAEPNAPVVMDAQLPPKMQAIQSQWKTFVDSIAVEYAERIAPALDGCVQKIAAINEVLAGSVEPVSKNMATLGDLFAALQDRVDKSVTQSIIPAWQKLSPMIMTDALTISTTAFPMIETALDGLVTKFADTAKGISDAWASIKRGIADPVNWVIDTVINTGLKNAWNGVRGTIPSLPEWTSTAERISGYHRGGIMSGYTPGRDDRVIAVGGGEAVMRPEFTRGMGPDWINNMNRVARTSGVQGVKNAAANFAGNFNTGGIVGAMTSAVQEKFPGMSMTSGLRYTDSGYHSKGMAADFSDGGNEGSPGMRSLAGWIADNFGPPKTLQLIHKPFNRNIGQGVGWVGDGDAFYEPWQMDAHRDHVHWATDQIVDANGTTTPGPVDATGGAFSAAASGRISELFTKPVAALKDSMPDFGPTLFGGSMPREFMQSIIDAASKAVGGARNAGGSSLDAGTTPFDISAGVEQWDANIRAALAREGFEVNERNVQLTKAQMQTESGGNPNIVQQVQDVNSGGNEAVGAMQVTPGTFAGFRNPELPNDRTNVDASLSAALRWYRHRYGDDLGQMWGQGHGYDQGGVFENGTVGWNTSGKPEAVFTNDQWMKIDQLIEALTRPDIYDALTNGTGRVALQANDAGVSSQDVATLGETAGDLTQSTDNLLDYQDGQAAAVEGQVLNAEGVPTNFRPEDSYKGSTAPIKPEDKSGYEMTPFMKALTGLGSALVRPDMGQRLSDPYYYNKLQQYAKDRNAQSDAAFAAGNDELGRALSDFDPGMGYAPGTQAQLATMGTQEEQFAQWQTTTAQNFESYFRDNWQGMLGSVVAGAGGATYNIGSIQTNSWKSAQRSLDRSARRSSRANSRAGGR